MVKCKYCIVKTWISRRQNMRVPKIAIWETLEYVFTKNLDQTQRGCIIVTRSQAVLPSDC